MIREKIEHKLVFPTDNENIVYMCMYCSSGGSSKVITTTWDEKREMFFRTSQQQFDGKTIKVGFLLGKYSAQVENKDGSYKPYKTGGVGLRMVITTCDKLNLTYELHLPTKGLTGFKDNQGNWDGIVGDLISGKIKVGVGLSVNHIRFNYVDVTSPYEFTHLTFVHGPTEVIYSWKSIWWPLDQSLWVYVGFSVISAFVFLTLLNKACYGLNNDQSVESAWSLQRSIEFLIFAFLFQGGENPRSTVLRYFVAAWYLFIIVITTAYLSKLFGFFVNPIKAKAPQDFDELAASDYTIGLSYYGGLIYSFFRGSSQRTYTEIFPRLTKQTNSECLSNATKPKFVCICFDVVAKMTESTKNQLGHSTLVFTPASAMFFAVSLVVEKRSILLQQFSRITRSTAESGLVEYWKLLIVHDFRGNNNATNAKGISIIRMQNAEHEPLPL
ncbi:unnamed protein product, partial [Allacma fusca]